MAPKLIFILIFLNSLFFATTITAQDFEWAKRIGGTGDDNIQSIILDKSGNVYTTGHFESTVDFDPSTGTANISSVGNYDIFISKLDVNGNYVWAKSIGGAFDEASYSIAVDSSGNVYTVGFFSSVVDFDPSAGVFNLTPNYAQSIFILKLDSLGNFVWAKSVGTKTTAANQYSHPYMAIDASANVYVSNAFIDTIDFDPGIGIFNLNGGGVFILKLDSFGDFVWAKKIGGAECYGLAVDVAGNVYSTGEFGWTDDFDPGVGVYNLIAQGYGDFYILKLDNSGNFVWAKSIDGEFGTYPSGITVDINNNAYITGKFNDTLDFNPDAGIFNLFSNGCDDIFILKLDVSGNFVWAKNMGGTGCDASRAIALDKTGNIYITGHFFGTADFDPNAGTINLNSNGIFDIFISKLDPNGNLVWAKGMGGTNFEGGMDIILDSLSSIYTTGFFRATVDFDPNAGIYNLTSAGQADMYIHKMSQPQNTSITKTENPLPISLYPNPSNGIVQLEIPQDFRIANIEIINTLGQVLGRTQTSDKNSRLVLPKEAGIYFVRVEIAGAIRGYRVVRE